MKFIFKAIYYLFLVALIGLGALLITSLVPIPGNYDIKIVKSGSMEPAIKVGSIVLVKPAGQYKTGDIITFGEDTKTDIPTTHRIVEMRAVSGELFYTVKGDANEEPDTTEVRQSEVIGKVILTIPYLGYVLDFARTPVGFVLLVGIPAAVVVFDEVGSIFREIKRMRSRRRSPQESDVLPPVQ